MQNPSKSSKPSNPSKSSKPSNASDSVSVSPSGEAFPLPKPEDYAKEFKRLQKLVAAQRKEGREIVVVMGLGFVGAVMAGVVADSEAKLSTIHHSPSTKAPSSLTHDP